MIDDDRYMDGLEYENTQLRQELAELRAALVEMKPLSRRKRLWVWLRREFSLAALLGACDRGPTEQR